RRISRQDPSAPYGRATPDRTKRLRAASSPDGAGPPDGARPPDSTRPPDGARPPDSTGAPDGTGAPNGALIADQIHRTGAGIVCGSRRECRTTGDVAAVQCRSNVKVSSPDGKYIVLLRIGRVRRGIRICAGSG